MRTTALLASFIALAGCSRKIQGPAPAVSGARNERDQSTAPAYLCNAQGDAADGWLVDALGDNFAPLPVNSLSGAPGLLMPTVRVDGPESYTLPPAYVRFVNKTRMPLAMRTGDTAADAHALQAGDYTLTVTNADNDAATSPAGALRVIPPPTITSVSLAASGGPAGNSLCADQAQTLTITGTGFRTDLPPSVTIGAHTFTAATPNSTTATVNIPAGTFTAGETSAAGTIYTVVLTNPEGCKAPVAAQASAQVTAFPTCSLLGTLSITPHFGYQLKDAPVTITDVFSQPATQPFSGALPRVAIVAPLAAGGSAQAIPMRSVGFVDQHTITAVIPVCSGTSFGAPSGATPADCPGIAPGGPYDVTVVDPGSGAGRIVGAFTVLSNPPPVVAGISPTSIATSGVSDLKVTGQHFDTTSTVLIGTPATGGVQFCPTTIHAATTPSATLIEVDVPGSFTTGCYVEDNSGNRTASAGFSLNAPSSTTPTGGQYLVRVQHGGDVASADFASLLVTGSSFNPFDGGVAKSKLAVARGQAGMVVAYDDTGQPYLYVAGGSTTGVDALDSVEVAPIGPFGDLGGDCTAGACTFRQLGRTPLPSARAGLSLVQRSIGGSVNTSYLYAIGGRAGGVSPAILGAVLRAQVLRTIDAPTMRKVSAATGAGPGAGIWYYKVAALGLSADVPETLASDEGSITLDTGAPQPSITWGCTAGATSYRVYRSPAAGAVSNAEVKLKDVAASCTGAGAGTMSFTDDGSVSPPTPLTKPLPRGAIGAWVDTGKSVTGRFDLQSRTLPDANGSILAIGGCTAESAGTHTGCATSSGAVEQLTFTNATDLDPAGSGAVGGGLLNARDRFGVGIATAGTANVAGGKSFVLVFGGEHNGSEISGSSSTVEVCDTTAETGPTVAAFTFASTGGPNNVGVGGWEDITANQGFSLATSATNHAIKTQSGTLGAGPFARSADFGVSFNNTGGVNYAQGGDRFLGSEQLFRAFIYIAGGFPADNDFSTVTSTVELFEY